MLKMLNLLLKMWNNRTVLVLFEGVFSFLQKKHVEKIHYKDTFG